MSEPQTFEMHMRQLEQIVGKLEQGEVPLDQALKAFEDGMKLVSACREQLVQAELKVEQVINAQGQTAPVEVV
ncbi:MAG: exodeoxyribonuclease VII small subunit [Alphaproteobacteria bacterium]|nr:MAG: exodeoxyribonuclease VII small subunit [Alphaproteobacteria bacterium]